MWVGGNLEQVKRNFALLPCLSQGLLNMQPLQMLSSGPLMGAAATRLSSRLLACLLGVSLALHFLGSN